MTPALILEDLLVRYGPGAPAVQHLSLQIGAGEVLALMGESGSGKSTTGLALLGLLPPSAEVSGRLTLGDQRLDLIGPVRWRPIRGAQIGMMFQGARSALHPFKRVGAQIIETIRCGPRAAQRRPGRGEARDKALRLVAEAGLPDPEAALRAWPHELSGGQARRAALALALAGDPAVLVVDEPTAGLDPTVQRAVVAGLVRAARQRQVALLVITHDPGVVAEAADRLLVISKGREVASRPVHALPAEVEAAQGEGG